MWIDFALLRGGRAGVSGVECERGRSERRGRRRALGERGEAGVNWRHAATFVQIGEQYRARVSKRLALRAAACSRARYCFGLELQLQRELDHARGLTRLNDGLGGGWGDRSATGLAEER